jgi:hypothetical protein
MPYKSNNTNKQSRENLGQPTGAGQSPAGVKPVDENSEDDFHEELRAYHRCAARQSPQSQYQ